MPRHEASPACVGVAPIQYPHPNANSLLFTVFHDDSLPNVIENPSARDRLTSSAKSIG
jgi:hypothetical protein